MGSSKITLLVQELLLLLVLLPLGNLLLLLGELLLKLLHVRNEAGCGNRIGRMPSGWGEGECVEKSLILVHGC